MPNQPNVVIFFTDQQRWDCSSLHGNPLDLMPNFDRVARRATHVANSFTCQPVCGPARSCLQTGQYATNTGVWHNGPGLKDDAVTLAQCFNNAGYHTGYIGKWHLGQTHHYSGFGGIVPTERRGGYKQWLATDALEFSIDEYHTILYDNDNQPVKLPGYRVDAVADAGIRFIDQHQRIPFFLMMSFIEPHHQNDRDDYPAPDGYREKYTGRWTPPDLAALPSWNTTLQRTQAPNFAYAGGSTHQHLGGYYGMVKRLDEAFGRVLDSLKTLGLDENTIVLFTSDHGCHFKTRNPEYKRSCHDASIRVPTLLAGPGFENRGQLHELVSLIDLPPTLLDACGLAIPDTMQGRSLMPLLRRQPTDWPTEIIAQISESAIARTVRTHRWKYCVTAPKESEDNQGGASKYVETHLYDLRYDPYELFNLINSQVHQKVRDVMRSRLLNRMSQIGEPQPEIELAEPKPSGQLRVEDAEALQ